MNPRLIVIDGKSYKSVNEMPPDVRRKYEQAMNSLKDQNGNRVPDALEGMNPLADRDRDGMPDVFEQMTSHSISAGTMKVIVDGKEFNGIEDLPPEARAQYEQAMSQLDANRNGVPDFLEGMLNMPKQTVNVSTSFGAEPPRRTAQPLTASPTITPDTSSGWMIALAGLFVFLLCVAGTAAVWYFFLRG